VPWAACAFPDPDTEVPATAGPTEEIAAALPALLETGGRGGRPGAVPRLVRLLYSDGGRPARTGHAAVAAVERDQLIVTAEVCEHLVFDDAEHVRRRRSPVCASER
jgi:hypothetical protein